MSTENPLQEAAVARLLELYDEALPQVYGYVRRRADSDSAAEDLTSETFMAALHSLRLGTVTEVTVAWLIGIARHKLADHWRRQSREDRRTERVSQQQRPTPDPWDDVLDAQLAHRTLATLSVTHRAALSLRYLDGLPVGTIASHLGRTPGATEALLTRAKAAFRQAYPGERGVHV